MRRALVRGTVLVALVAAAILVLQSSGGLLGPKAAPSPTLPSPSPTSAVPTLAAPPVVSVGRSAAFDPQATRSPTGSVAQSKVWFNDGTWWGLLLTGADELHIFRLDWSRQTWTDTATFVDERPNARADSLWDGEHLYVVTGPAMTNLKQGIRLLRFRYDRSTQRYTLDPDFPLFLTEAGADEVILSKDSAGTLWLTYIAPIPGAPAPGASPSPAPESTTPAPSGSPTPAPSGGPSPLPTSPPGAITTGSIWGLHSTIDDLHWDAPVELPLGLTSAQVAQLAAVATGTELVVVWTTRSEDAVYAGHHADTAPDSAWTVTRTPVDGAAGASDGLSLRSLPGDSERRLFVGFIDALDRRPQPNPLWPRAILLVIQPDGTGSIHQFGRLDDHHAQPLVIIDGEHRTVYMLATAPTGGGAVFVKSASLERIGFSAGLGEPLVSSPSDATIGSPSTSKQAPDSTSGMLVLTSDNGTGHYVQAAMSLGGAEPGGPAGSPFPSASPTPPAVANDLVDDTFDPWEIGGPVPNGWALASGSGGTFTIQPFPSSVDRSARLTTTDARLRARACKSFPAATATVTAQATVLVDGIAGPAATMIAVRGAGGDLAALRFGGRATFVYLSGRDEVTTPTPYRLNTWYRVSVVVHLAAHTYDWEVTDAAGGAPVASAAGVPDGVPTAPAADGVCFGTSAGAPELSLYFDDVIVARP